MHHVIRVIMYVSQQPFVQHFEASQSSSLEQTDCSRQIATGSRGSRGGSSSQKQYTVSPKTPTQTFRYRSVKILTRIFKLFFYWHTKVRKFQFGTFSIGIKMPWERKFLEAEVHVPVMLRFAVFGAMMMFLRVCQNKSFTM